MSLEALGILTRLGKERRVSQDTRYSFCVSIQQSVYADQDLRTQQADPDQGDKITDLDQIE
jgi:hypothetical protein